MSDTSMFGYHLHSGRGRVDLRQSFCLPYEGIRRLYGGPFYWNQVCLGGPLSYNCTGNVGSETRFHSGTVTECVDSRTLTA